jgi:hypothetical protein
MKSIGTQLLLSILVLASLLPTAALAQGLPEPGALALHAAQEYRMQARYPGDSTVLPAGAEDPVRADLRTTPVISRGRDGEVTSLAVESAKLSYEAGATVEFFATPAGSEVLAITGDVTTETGEPIGTLHFFDDGFGTDERAGDGVYSASFPLAESLRPDLAEVHVVTVLATFANGETRRAVGGYLLSNPWSRLTGRYRDRVDNGNIVVSAEIEVTRPGRFHLIGTLHTTEGEPIGTAQTAQELTVGKHWMDLSFYGLMFHDREVVGPYRLGSLALRTTGAMPNAFTDLVENAHLIPAVPLERLTAQPANDRGLLQAAEVLEAEVARLRGER